MKATCDKKRKSSSKSSSASTPITNNQTNEIHKQLPHAIRSDPNYFHGLKASEVDPEDYIHPNYWKSINQKEGVMPRPKPRSVMSPKITWKDDLTTSISTRNL